MRDSERRRSPRLFHSAKAELQWYDGSKETASTIDVSRGGALFDVGRRPQLGELVMIRFSSLTSFQREVVATVRRVVPAFQGRRYLLAVTFVAEQPGLYHAACNFESRFETLPNTG